MKHMKPTLLFIVLFLNPCILFSDTITLIDGSRIEGRVLNSTEGYVYIADKDSTIHHIRHNQIKSVYFSWADVIYLSSGNTIKCKIINSVSSNLHVLTEEGLQIIHFSEIKMYFYHSAEGITTPDLPITGSDFKNQKAFRPKGLKHSLYFGFHYGNNLSPYKSERRLSNSELDLDIGIKGGYYLTNSISFGGGFKYAKYCFDNYLNLQSLFSTINLHGDLEYSVRVEKRPASYAFIGLNIGVFNVYGQIFCTYIDPESHKDDPILLVKEITFNKKSYALIPHIGVRTFLEKRISVGLEIAFLFENSEPIQIPLEFMDDLITNFRRFYFSINMSYHIR